ncbi:hypothetical protein AAMO2058_001574100 [Amorphochlora amoebiformis]
MVSRSRVGRVVVSRCLILQKLFRYSRKSMWYVLGLFGCLSLFLVHVAITKKAIEDAVQRAKLLESGKNPIPNLNFNTVKQLNPFEINPLFNKTLRARSKFNITPASTLHVFLQKDYTFMFHPVVMTLKLGAYASSIPYVVRYIPQPQFLKVLETIQNDEEHQGLAAKLVLGEHSPMPHLRDHVSDGDVVVWIGPLAFPWEALSHRKVYLVHAQMEPLGLHGCDFGFILKSAEHVHEMWHYSLRNKRIMETTCKDGISPDVVHRYMPIAYDPFMTKIVQKDASNPGLDSSKITFLGALEFGNRRECWDIIVKTSPNDIKSLYNTRYDLFSAPQLKSFLKRSGGLYLNIHKECLHEQENQSCEGVRFATLLSAKGLVFSQPCSSVDQAEYEGLIDFLDIHRMGHRIQQIINVPVHERQEIADMRARMFKERFDAFRIFTMNGVRTLFAVEHLARNQTIPQWSIV